MPLSYNYGTAEYTRPNLPSTPPRTTGGYAFNQFGAMGRQGGSPVTPPQRWFGSPTNAGYERQAQEDSYKAWQVRKTGFKSPTAKRTPPQQGYMERGRERVHQTYKTRTPSPAHAAYEVRTPRTASPMAPPKRVFSTPPNRAYSEHTWKDRVDEVVQPLPPQSPPERRPSMLWDGMSQFIIAPQTEEDRGKYVVVLDLDETVVYARDGPIQCRPGYKEMIRVLGQHCETVVWTAGERSYAKEVLKQIDTVGTIRHCIYRHHLWFDGQPGQVKDLRLLGRDPDKVLLVENTPDCLRKNATQAILVPDFRGRDEKGILTLLTVFLKDMVKSGLPVAQYLRQSPLITPREVQTNVGDTIICHTIGDSDRDFQHRAPNPDMRPPAYTKYYKR